MLQQVLNPRKCPNYFCACPKKPNYALHVCGTHCRALQNLTPRDATQHSAFTIGPHRGTPTTRTKVNSFHLLPSIGYRVNGILLETNARDMNRSMTMMPRGDDKDEPRAKTPKQEA